VTSWISVHSVLIALSILIACAPGFAIAGNRSVWISPDWLFSGDKVCDPVEVRRRVRSAVATSKELGATAVFVETLNRGQSITPGRDPDDPLPVDPLISSHFPKEGNLLDVFIDAGRDLGVEIHAWIHVCYFRSDNGSFRRPWQDGATIFDPLFADSLDRAAPQIRNLYKKRAAESLAALFKNGFSWEPFVKICDSVGASSFEGLTRNLIMTLCGSGADAPEFLLTTPTGEIHPGLGADRILGIYVNPEHDGVRKILLKSIRAIGTSHPGLSGIHLDHIRYPSGARGSPGTFAAFPENTRKGFYTPRHDDVENLEDWFARRKGFITSLVNEIAGTLDDSMVLSAAVHPGNYGATPAPDQLIGPEEYVCQDWANWDVDFVIPLLYGKPADRVLTLLGQEIQGANRIRSGAPRVVPGISSSAIAKGWKHSRDWAFFDMLGFRESISGIPGSAIQGMGLSDGLY